MDLSRISSPGSFTGTHEAKRNLAWASTRPPCLPVRAPLSAAHSQAQEACLSAVGSTPHVLPVFAVGSSQVKKQAHNCPVTWPWAKDQNFPFPTVAPSHSIWKADWVCPTWGQRALAWRKPSHLENQPTSKPRRQCSRNGILAQLIWVKIA